MNYRPAYFWSFAWPFLLVLLLVGGVSYFDPLFQPSGSIAPGKYVLQADLNGESTSLEGSAFFEYVSQPQGLGGQQIFKLHFLDASRSGGPGFGFLIPINDSGRPIFKDTYRVDQEARGFINGNGSVYGYADLHRDDSGLYFAEFGSISIGEGSGEEEVSGNLDIVMDDGSGGTIRLKGGFNARKLPSNIKL